MVRGHRLSAAVNGGSFGVNPSPAVTGFGFWLLDPEWWLRCPVSCSADGALGGGCKKPTMRGRKVGFLLFHAQRACHKFSARKIYSFTRSTYCPVRVSMRTFSPSSTKGGT